MKAQEIIKLAYKVYAAHDRIKKLTIENACAELKVKNTAHRKTLWQVAAASMFDESETPTMRQRNEVSQARAVAEKMVDHLPKKVTPSVFEKTFNSTYGSLNNCLRKSE